MKYEITYTDNQGKINGVIENKFTEEFNYSEDYSLILKLGPILFKGDTFDGLELQNEDSYSEEELNRFSFEKLRVHGTDEIVKELTNCKLEFEFQLEIVNKHSLQLQKINGILIVDLGSFSPRKHAIFQYDFSIGNDEFNVNGDSFEELFDNLKELIKKSYLIKNCYGCNYSDYSPYGRDSFGDMQCFKSAKDKYLKISGKVGLFQLMSSEKVIHVQEIYVCDEFEFRKMNVGYRG